MQAHRTSGRLVLSRKLGETIVIGEGDSQIVLTVLEIRRGHARLGIRAPRDVVVRRDDYLPKQR